jgi:hypothetical protein
LDFSVFEGACSTVPCVGRIVISAMTWDVTPASGYNVLGAGDYTIRLDNLSSRDVAASYEVRLATQ